MSLRTVVALFGVTVTFLCAALTVAVEAEAGCFMWDDYGRCSGVELRGVKHLEDESSCKPEDWDCAIGEIGEIGSGVARPEEECSEWFMQFWHEPAAGGRRGRIQANYSEYLVDSIPAAVKMTAITVTVRAYSGIFFETVPIYRTGPPDFPTRVFDPQGLELDRPATRSGTFRVWVMKPSPTQLSDGNRCVMAADEDMGDIVIPEP